VIESPLFWYRKRPSGLIVHGLEGNVVGLMNGVPGTSVREPSAPID
jgi:hypothetical protein